MEIDFELLFNALPHPAIALGPDDRVIAANSLAEPFFGMSARSLRKRWRTEIAPDGSRLAELVKQARQGALSVREFGMTLQLIETPPRVVDIHLAPVHEQPGVVVLLAQPRALAEKFDRSLAARGAARSLSGFSAALAHEVKNPLAGISGAAQLIEMNAGDEEAELARLIQAESKRIERLIGRMESVVDPAPGLYQAVNLHSALKQARASAEAGFGRGVRFVEDYDPSLPPAQGDRDTLMQALLNLIKNAVEAVGSGGTITLRTAFRPGVRIASLGGETRESLPLEISVIDNGPGVAASMIEHLFEPFVSSKTDGAGLGLAVVSKVIADHGGVIECDTAPGRTAFRILLPVWSGDAAPASGRQQKKSAPDGPMEDDA